MKLGEIAEHVLQSSVVVVEFTECRVISMIFLHVWTLQPIHDVGSLYG